MKRVLMLIALLGLAVPGQAQSAANNPAALVRELYRVHKNGYGPIFDGKTKKYLLKYFDTPLSDMIWKELTSKSDEVGNLDFDPLFNAQDVQVKNFKVASGATDGSNAEVLVSFNNYDRKENLKFLLKNTKAGWKITNIVYDAESDLIKILSAPH